MENWKKSSRSNGSGGSNCVEVRTVRDSALSTMHFEVRDSKAPAGPVLRFTETEWRIFIESVKDGEFD